jgi:hypothetical protein
MRGLLCFLLHGLVAGNFTHALIEARKAYPYDVLDLILCPVEHCTYSWQVHFTQMYRQSACVDLIPHGRTQFIIDLDHECQYARRNETFETTCEEFQDLPVIDILGFEASCWAASPMNVFTEECSNICKHGRPVSRCVYTVDPGGNYALEDTLDGCVLTSLCMCHTSDMSICDLEARFVECYRTDEAIARLEAEAELAELTKSMGLNTSIGTHYDALEKAYNQQATEVNELEEENEEVGEQLESALAMLKEQRNKNKAEVAARSRLPAAGAAVNQNVISVERLDAVNHKLKDEIQARKVKEAELRQAKERNFRLLFLLALVLLALVGAAGAAVHFMRKKQSVYFVHNNELDPNGEEVMTASNSTVVMGRAVSASNAKEQAASTGIAAGSGAP